MPEKGEIGIEDKPEIIEGMNKCKDRIISFVQERGIDVKDRLPDNEDIYFLKNKMFEKVTPDPNYNGLHQGNEIIINGEKPKDDFLYHELVHCACMTNIYIRNEKQEDNTTGKEISVGYASKGENKYLKFFNEGLTETTTQQIYIENNEMPPFMVYRPQVIFVTELANDIADKINEKEPKKLSQKDIMTHLQIGMLQADRSYLKIIIDNYGKEAFKALTKMGVKKEDVIEVSRIFKLPTVEEKINSFYNKTETEITLGDKVLVCYGKK